MLTPTSRAAIARLCAYKAPATHYHDLPLTRRAAVLLLLFADRKGDLRVVLTIRSATLRNFAGQAALPGGKAEAVDNDPFETARREAHEEIGLPISDDKLPAGYIVQHLTELPCNLAVTGLGVRPCVAFLATNGDDLGSMFGTGEPMLDPTRDILPRLEVDEVDALFTAPFHTFLRQADPPHGTEAIVPGKWYEGSWHSWHEEAWRMHTFNVSVTPGAVVRSRRLRSDSTSRNTRSAAPQRGSPSATKPEYVPKTIRADANLDQPRYKVFGMTARILVDCARVAYGHDPDFEHNSTFGDEAMIGKLQRMGRLGGVREDGEMLTRDVMKAAAKL